MACARRLLHITAPGTGELEEPFLSSERSVILEDGQEGLPCWNRWEMPLAGNA